MMSLLENVFSNVAAAFIVMGLIFLYAKMRLGDVRGAWRVGMRMKSNGITNFFANRADYVTHRKHGTIAQYMNLTQKELVYVGLWLSHGMEMANIRGTIVDLLNRGCYVEFNFIDVTVPFIDHLADYLAIPPEDVVARVSSSMRQLVGIRNDLDENLRNRFVLRTHTKLITSSAFLIDQNTQTSRALVDFKAYGLGRDKSFGIEFAGVPAPNTLFQRLSDSFTKVRNSASNV